MDIKEFRKNIKKACDFMIPPTGRKECIKTMMCNWNHCQKEQIDLANAALTDADRESCKNKDFSKEFDCEEKLIEKKGLLDKMAALNHCEANKCPQVRAYIKKEMNKKINKNIKLSDEQEERNKCIESHCSKEKKKDEEEEQKLAEKIFECQKKYATIKEQNRCDKSALKNKTKSFNNKHSCYIKYCKFKSSKSSKKTNKKTKKN